MYLIWVVQEFWWWIVWFGYLVFDFGAWCDLRALGVTVRFWRGYDLEVLVLDFGFTVVAW